MDDVHLASSRQVHLSFNGVIVDVGAPATRQFLCPPIEIRFATLVAAAQLIFDCPPQAFSDGKLRITAACQILSRIAEKCSFTNSLTKIHSTEVLGRSS